MHANGRRTVGDRFMAVRRDYVQIDIVFTRYNNIMTLVYRHLVTFAYIHKSLKNVMQNVFLQQNINKK